MKAEEWKGRVGGRGGLRMGRVGGRVREWRWKRKGFMLSILPYLRLPLLSSFLFGLRYHLSFLFLFLFPLVFLSLVSPFSTRTFPSLHPQPFISLSSFIPPCLPLIISLIIVFGLPFPSLSPILDRPNSLSPSPYPFVPSLPFPPSIFPASISLLTPPSFLPTLSPSLPLCLLLLCPVLPPYILFLSIPSNFHPLLHTAHM